MSLKNHIENNIVIVLLGSIVVAFASGFEGHKQVAESQGQTLILQTKLDYYEQQEKKWDIAKAKVVELEEVVAAKDEMTGGIESRTSSLGQRFGDGTWRFFTAVAGEELADRLTELAPPSSSVYVTTDTRQGGKFYVWYKGQNTSTVYKYVVGNSANIDTNSRHPRTYTFPEEYGSEIIPIGLGTTGGEDLKLIFLFASN